VFATGLQTTVRQVINTRGHGVEDIITDECFTGRWSEMVNQRRLEELDTKHSPTGPSDCDVKPIPVVQTLRGSENASRYNPETAEYWESIAAEIVRRYVKLVVEPRSSGDVAMEINKSALNKTFVGEDNVSVVAIVLDYDLVQEYAYRPLDRKPMPSHVLINKMIQGVLSERDGNVDDDGKRNAPRNNDVMFLCDGGRDIVKTALWRP
jgi:hypothetical protein